MQIKPNFSSFKKKITYLLGVEVRSYCLYCLVWSKGWEEDLRDWTDAGREFCSNEVARVIATFSSGCVTRVTGDVARVTSCLGDGDCSLEASPSDVDVNCSGEASLSMSSFSSFESDST